MRGRRAITPVIAVILLIVMTVGIAALTFVWMQNFVQNLQQQTQQQASQLQRPQFAITYATNSANNKAKIIISNVGTVPIDTSKIKFTIEEYKLLDGSYEKAVATAKTGTCNPSGNIAPNQDTTCEVQLDGTNTFDFKNYYYVITASYRGFTAQYTLRK